MMQPETSTRLAMGTVSTRINPADNYGFLGVVFFFSPSAREEYSVVAGITAPSPVSSTFNYHHGHREAKVRRKT